jgi:uridine phosphorylase
MSEPTLARQTFPLLEYDASPGVIVPHIPGLEEPVPERWVLCFFAEQIRALVEQGVAVPIGATGSEMGPLPIYRVEHNGCQIALMLAGVGAPFAAAMLDEAIGSGALKVIVCGGCGVLDREIAVGHLLVPELAVRDEGTSYHYLPASRTVSAPPEGVAAVVAALTAAGIPFLRTATWTTDAFYRETPAKVRLRREEGCLCVEMEAAALFAVAHYRGIALGQILYAGDDVSGPAWDSRSWNGRAEARSRVLELALDACCRL